MKVLIVRHADAGDRDEWEKTGRPDEERPLSNKGVEQMRAAARGLVALVPEVDLIVTSPYTRAVETAEIVRGAYGGKTKQETSPTLEPEESPERFSAWLRKQNGKVIAAVGHEPHLGMLATWFMSGNETSSVEMKKGGACLIAFDEKPKKGSGTLQWLMGPKQLARQV